MTPAGAARDHGGGLDAALAEHGGARADWLDLSTGINPVPYPVGDLPFDAWTALPDRAAQERLIAAARRFWRVPESAAILAAPGASALIAKLPTLFPAGAVRIPGPTYNEHEAAFRAAGWKVTTRPAKAQVAVHPNNPDGRVWQAAEISSAFSVIDESFCDIRPDASLVALAARPGVVVLKSFGKFWGLAGLRLGFAIGQPDTIEALAEALGPWPVSGPALAIGARALEDHGWAETSRARLKQDAKRLDALLTAKGAAVAGGTDLFRLYEVDDAAAWQARLARARVWSRVFPWSSTHLRLGLPAPDRWGQIEAAL
ncbi:threonine-phosphate decarboxylase CobD [Limimaricola pyoseonensis]|uniref:threonine-phosphate decarboxylase n=1 Tax=Limimaricola pyoseonensis TaxID=521013 RepID=A0A1G7F5Y3_9RHOB|nr:threonine-phosphate decarboxylase CobD [Limimaricola pyoseonensis]SDE71291.1 L-threonine O-3-phosphate decarboxylase [Limimaricola pyoseonensis]